MATYPKVSHLFLNASFLFLCSVVYFSSSPVPTTKTTTSSNQILLQATTSSTYGGVCDGLEKLSDSKSKCSFLRFQNPCILQGYIDYLQVFYCLCGDSPVLGYSLLLLWLLVLFYLLGNTASDYFCSSLEGLSASLRLSPPIAGVTLLSLGNGAPDVFASIVSFTGSSSSGEVGISSVLGGAFFVSTVVVGIITVCVPGHRVVAVDRSSFLRDTCFLLTAQAMLVAMLTVGSVTIWAALGFVLLYLVYVLVVSVTYCCRGGDEEDDGGQIITSPLLVEREISIEIVVEEEEDPILIAKAGGLDEFRSRHGSRHLCRFLYVLGLPLYLPRRLTIPVVSEERWSKPYAVASVALSPLLLALLWNTHRTTEEDSSSPKRLQLYLVAALVGLVLAILAMKSTKSAHPPKRFLLPWLVGGFLMSVVWAYITAGELVALLVSLGTIAGISPSVLGLTVLAWGNSIGDLVSNVAMAVNGGATGAQVAVSGCYAGPLFNTLVGLGMSLVLSAWGSYPEPFVVPADGAVLEIVGFLVGGVLWAAVMVTRREMRVDRVVGVGLLVIYLCFLSLRVSESFWGLYE